MPEDNELLKINALEGATVAEWIPPFWIGPHAGKRLIEAMRTLSRLPMRRISMAIGSAWPAYEIEYSDRSQYEDDEVWKLENQKQNNQICLMPSAFEITQMEQVIAWPGHYLIDWPQLLRTVGTVALWRSRDQDIGFVARRKLKLRPYVVRKWNIEGLDKIAYGLIRDRVPVF